LTATPVLAGDPPYLKLAQALGTPALADSARENAKAPLLLHFVPRGQNAEDWKKMTTVSILKVPETDTDQAARGVIVRLHDTLKAHHAKIVAFDESALPPATCYFEFSVAGEKGAGIVYSPDPGFVTVAQVSVKGSLDAADAGTLRGILKLK
jgi:hypothetical protein